MRGRVASHGVYRVLSVRGGQGEETDDLVAEEIPVAISYNRRPYAVMLATPEHLEAFALGFSLSEGVIDAAEELEQIAVVDQEQAIELRLRIPEARLSRVPDTERALEGRSGCGICGSRELSQLLQPPPRQKAQWSIDAAALERAARELELRQRLQRVTGGVHAAAWADRDGKVHCLAEDVGRHNALDKLIGVLTVSGRSAGEGFVMVTSRASFELVQKTARVGIPMLAAVSAPTGLAVRLAREADMTLIGFTRPPERYVVYAGAHRVALQEDL